MDWLERHGYIGTSHNNSPHLDIIRVRCGFRDKYKLFDKIASHPKLSWNSKLQFNDGKRTWSYYGCDIIYLVRLFYVRPKRQRKYACRFMHILFLENILSQKLCLQINGSRHDWRSFGLPFQWTKCEQDENVSITNDDDTEEEDFDPRII
jgi:hypothetical protein